MEQSNILSTIIISSSGTSGPPKDYVQPLSKIIAANKVARKAQGITADSRVYTVMKLTHAGGLLGQTMPALEIGGHVTCDVFIPYKWIKKIKNFTHSHLTPMHAKAIMRTKGFQDLDLTGVTITCGAEPVTWDIIEAFVIRGCKLITNWGMSEIGPIAINHTFENMEEVNRVKALCPNRMTIMGSDKYCDWLLEKGELVVKGDICIYNDWYRTKDKAVVVDDILFYAGRTNKEVDFNNPSKG